MPSKSIIVTGASRGIGFAILEKFASQGWNIAFCSHHIERVEQAEKKLREQFPTIQILAKQADVSQKEEVTSFATDCLTQFQKIDILVNNAGQYIPGIISAADESDELEELMKVNLYSAYWIGKKIIPSMIENRSGHIFNMSSIAGLQAYHNGGSYAITKFALQGYTRTLREELKAKNIRVTGIYPGAVLTDSWAGTDLPTSRFIDPHDIAELVYTTHMTNPSTCVEDLIIRPQEGDI